MTNAEIRATPADLLYVVVYRMGGTANFEWRASIAMSQAEAIAAKETVERGGRRAMVQKYSDLLAIGMPETYE